MAGELRRFSRRRLLQAAGVGTAALALPGIATAAPSTGGAVSDVFRTGDRHAVTTSGAVARQSGEVEAGQLTEFYQAWRIAAGGRLSVPLRIQPRQPLTLQIREVRPADRWGAWYGYTVRIGDTVVYTRDPGLTDEGGGPYTSVFLDTADPDLLRTGSVLVSVEGGSAAPVFLAEIWAYANLSDLVAGQDMRVPTRIVGVLGKDYQPDSTLRDAAAYLTTNLHTSDQVSLGGSVLDYFAVRTPAQMASNYQRYLAISRTYDLPMTIESTSDWEGTPGGAPDGKGGTFGDIEYQQILWSPQDQTGPDKDVWKGKSLSDLLGADYDPHYGLSVPNIWGNTPWLTWRHPDLNAFYTGKANESIDQIRPLIWSLQRSGETARLLPFSTTMEATYWSAKDGIGVADGAYTDYNGGVARKDILADFNPATVAAAAADGVTLDPRNGLSDAAKHWLFKNQSYPQQMYADIFYFGLPRERIVVGPDGLNYPTDMLRHNIFCEIYSRMQAPYWSGEFASIAQGVVRHARPGSEYIELDNYNRGGFQHLTRMREFGRLADPNLEDSVSGDPTDKTLLLRQLYANGSRYATLYNWTKGNVEQYVNPFVDDLSPYDVRLDGAVQETVTGQVIGQTFVAGSLRLLDRIDVRLTPRKTTVHLRLTDAGGRVLAMRHLSTAEQTSGWVTFRVPVVETEPGQRYHVEVRDATVDLVVAADGDAVTVDGVPRTGRQLALRTGLDLEYQRDRSLVIQWRRDAADAIANVGEQLGRADATARRLLDRASALLAADRYVQAYRTAIQADASRFPVLFQVSGTGRLDPFGLTVGTDSTVDVDVVTADGDAITATLRAYVAGPVTLADVATCSVDGAAVPVRGGVATVDLGDTAEHSVRLKIS